MTMPFDQLLHSITARAKTRDKLRSTTLPATLSHLVLNIVFVCTEKKMPRVNTNRIIAAMQNMKSLVKFSIRKFITNTMRGSIFTFQPELAVKFRLTTASLTKPLPTFVRCSSVYLTPKSFNVRGVHRHRISYPRGVSQ